MQPKIKCQGTYTQRREFEKRTSNLDEKIRTQIEPYLFPNSDCTDPIPVSQQVPLIGYWLSKEVRTRNSPEADDQDWIRELDQSIHNDSHVEFLDKVLDSKVRVITRTIFEQIYRRTKILFGYYNFIDLRETLHSDNAELKCFKLKMDNQEFVILNFQSNRYPVIIQQSSEVIAPAPVQYNLRRPITLQPRPQSTSNQQIQPQRAKIRISNCNVSQKVQVQVQNYNNYQNQQVSAFLMDTQAAQESNTLNPITNITLTNNNLYKHCALCQNTDSRLIKLPCNCSLHKSCFKIFLNQQAMIGLANLKCPICQEELEKETIRQHLEDDKYQRFIQNTNQNLQQF